MPITNDDQIDYERVVADPEYRRLVIVYLNTQARPTDRRRPSQGSTLAGSAISFNASPRLDRAANLPLRRYG
jgi:hypothetical protein